MARGYSQGFTPGYNRKGFEGQGPVITGGAGFQSSLGETVNLGNNYGSLRKSATRFDELASTSIANRAAERATATEMEAQAHATGLSTMADVKSNKMIAEAQESAAKSQSQGSMMGTGFGAIGQIGGLLLGGIA